MEKTRVLKEYPLMQDFLKATPPKIHHAFFSVVADIISFDVSKCHIALGTTAGCTFLHSREHGGTIKVVSQNKDDHVTCVKLMTGLECQLAMGTKDGQVVIIIFSGSTIIAKQVRKYSLGKIHKNAICSLEWSPNGMKLFSADLAGCIFCTDVNFDLNTCTAGLLLNEEHEVVQMNYKHKTLLVSTLENSFLVYDGSKKDIGSKPTRRGRFGACFNSNTVAMEELVVFATRPGLRVWVANTSGTVMRTIKMKHLIENVMNPIKMQITGAHSSKKELSFGIVHLFGTDCLLSLYGSSLYVMNHIDNSIVGEMHGLEDVIDVKVTEDEIFVLCTGRKLHRIAYKPDDSWTGLSSPVHGSKGANKFMEMKASISGMKINLPPVIGQLQSKMGTLKVDQIATKLQAQAEELKTMVSSKPVMNFTNQLFHRRSVSEASSSKESIYEPDITSIDVIVKALMYDILELVELKCAEPEVQVAIPEIDKGNQDDSFPNKIYRFENIAVKPADEDIVFSSKRKKKWQKKKSLGNMALKTSNESLSSDDAFINNGLQQDNKKNIDGVMETNVKICDNDEKKVHAISSAHYGDNMIQYLLTRKETKNENFEVPVDNDLPVFENKTVSIERTLSCNQSTCSETNLSVENIEDVNVEQITVSPDFDFGSESKLKAHLNYHTTDAISSSAINNKASGSNNLFLGTEHASNSLHLNLHNTMTNRKENNDFIPRSPDIDIYKVDGGGDFNSEEDSETESQQSIEPMVFNVQQPSDIDQPVTDDEQYFKKLVQMKPELYGPSGEALKSSDMWSISPFPGSAILSLAGSGEMICCVSNTSRIYYREETSDEASSNVWNKFAKKAVQIALAPSGDFAWIVTGRGNVYAAGLPLELTEDRLHSTEVHLEWKLVLSKCSFVCLGTIEAWIVTSDGHLLREIGLSRSEPSMQQQYTVDVKFVKNDKIEDAKVKHVALTCDVIWVLTTSGQLLCKALTDVDTANTWHAVDSPQPFGKQQLQVRLIASDYKKTLWAVDDKGGLWCRSRVTTSIPQGHHWWEVYMNQYLYEEKHTTFLKLGRSAHPLSVTNIALSLQGIWVATDDNKLRMTRERVTGNAWKHLSISGVASSTTWSHITSSSLFSPEDSVWQGFIWVAQSKGEIICFPSSKTNQHKGVALSPPDDTSSSILCISASREALWMVLESGDIFVRSGISPTTPSGRNWNHVKVNNQLDDKLINVSCGLQSVWAVDQSGSIFVRMGTIVTESHETMSPAWLKLDGCPTAGSTFTQVICGPSDLNVWAINDQGIPYVRVGVTNEMPVGHIWKPVPGATVKQIVISNHAVRALCTDGSLLKRYGITQGDAIGDYWKKIPGDFHQLAVTPYDELFALDADNLLRYHRTHIYCPPLIEAMLDDGTSSSDSDSFKDKKLSQVGNTSQVDDLTWEII
ncbi:unnamed protein product [Clavelina lepadiformis]|uniref:Tectonin beta-propeller repeat-containing protein 2 n=1 Tax=Clavelina lepadiformis TaxID=159417 RepID=A0ABP0FLI2_CLALP